MREKYPPIVPFRQGMLDVGDQHLIYWEESGNPKGLPVLYLHGGPGSCTHAGNRSFFHPEKYRIILFDQRGCGKSTPHAELKNNTTWDLVKDIEKLRAFLKISSWLVFGGSWGSTLSLAYAQKHPDVVQGLILRGIFLGRKKELRWFYQFGAHHILTDAWEKYVEIIPLEERGDLISAYHRRLTSSDPEVRKKAAFAWASWEGSNLRLYKDPALQSTFTESFHAEAIARIECHYFQNHCFFPTDNFLLEGVDKIRHVPCVIVQGRYDMICPFESAWELHKAWPEARFEVIVDAGHSSAEPGITDALMRATDAFVE